MSIIKCTKKSMGMVIGIDASRNRSGGAKAHLTGLLMGVNPVDYGVKKIHLWAYRSLMENIPDYPWLEKHLPEELEKSIFHQAWWQYHNLPREIRKYGCDILFNTDAGSICQFTPCVTLSQDMLSFEPGEMKRFGFSKAWLRLLLLKYIQTSSLQRAQGIIFLTDYAREIIQKITGSLQSVTVVPHGIADEFRLSSKLMKPPLTKKESIRCIYISNAAMYKHQWHVVSAIKILRDRGFDLSLLLVGGGSGHAQRLLDKEINAKDPNREFVNQINFVTHSSIPAFLSNADLFIFASSCENMPITLLEAMASGLPIASSDRGPMPEILQDAGVYFNPEDPNSIAVAIDHLINSPDLQKKVMKRAQDISSQYSWERCAKETWMFFNSLGVPEN